jgi:hypothetical protein
MGLIADLEDIVLIDHIETGSGGLQVIQGESHITLSCKHDCVVAFLLNIIFLGLANDGESPQHFILSEFGKPNNSTSGLNRLNNFRAIIASQSESSCRTVLRHDHS